MGGKRLLIPAWRIIYRRIKTEMPSLFCNWKFFFCLRTGIPNPTATLLFLNQAKVHGLFSNHGTRFRKHVYISILHLFKHVEFLTQSEITGIKRIPENLTLPSRPLVFSHNKKLKALLASSSSANNNRLASPVITTLVLRKYINCLCLPFGSRTSWL